MFHLRNYIESTKRLCKSITIATFILNGKKRDCWTQNIFFLLWRTHFRKKSVIVWAICIVYVVSIELCIKYIHTRRRLVRFHFLISNRVYIAIYYWLLLCYAKACAVALALLCFVAAHKYLLATCWKQSSLVVRCLKCGTISVWYSQCSFRSWKMRVQIIANGLTVCCKNRERISKYIRQSQLRRLQMEALLWIQSHIAITLEI